jgi:hypothetical protein
MPPKLTIRRAERADLPAPRIGRASWSGSVGSSGCESRMNGFGLLMVSEWTRMTMIRAISESKIPYGRG